MESYSMPAHRSVRCGAQLKRMTIIDSIQGTRLHIYRWLDNATARSAGNTKALQSLPVIETKSKWTHKIHPGIATFGDKPDRVGPDYLDKLLHKAASIIPDNAHEDTPLFLLATAGMRMLDDDPRGKLLEQICSYAQSNTKFQLPDCEVHVKVIPGEVEGLYGWIAANYLLGGFDEPLQHVNGNEHPTFGFLDMGGASAQIAFAPNTTESERHANDLQMMRLRTVDSTVTEYKVFTATWLGFGVNEARKHYVEKLQKESASIDSKVIQDPCLPSGLTVSTPGDVLLAGSKEIKGKTPTLNGTGKFDKCLIKTRPLLEKDHVCEDEPCLIGGTHVPAIDFDVNHFVGVSEYWHTTHEIFQYDQKDKAYDFNTYQQRVSDFCSQDWGKIQDGIEAHSWGQKVDERTAIEVCFKASWLINILHEGIGIPRYGLENTPDSAGNGTKKLLDSTKDKGFKASFQAINKIDDTEVSWTLGKMVLYASSLIPPSSDSTLPVGFGSNVPGIPPDFQYPGSLTSTQASSNSTSQDDWSAKSLLHTANPRRIPGILLFLLILLFAIFLLLGRTRRQNLYNRLGRGSSGGKSTLRSSKRGGFLAGTLPSIFRSSPGLGNYERVLEDGPEPNDFELGSVSDLEEGNENSDSSSSSHASKTSGWATPRSRLANGANGSLEQLGSLGNGLGLGINAMDRSGLIGRTESRERLVGMAEGRRSRKASPSRGKMQLGSVVED